MKFRFLISLALLPFFSVAQTALENSQAFLQDFFAQKYDTATTYFDTSVHGKITPDFLRQTASSIAQQLGAYKKTLEKNETKESGYTCWYFYTAFEKANVDIKLPFNDKGKLIGFFIAPHKEIKKANPSSRDKTDYNILSGNLLLPGTLLLADTNNQKKLVIFIHGSGPQDRDETFGENKPFKDLAEGLLTNGISSYRFDKRTKVAPQSFMKDPTIDQEVTGDALNIIQYFHNNDSFRNYKLYIIAHSLGAMMAPRIALQTKQTLSGIVMLAAPARPFEDITLEQFEYLDSLQPSQTAETNIVKLKHQIDYLHSPAFHLTSPTDSLPLHLPSSYWQSLKEYEPLKSINKATTAFLILQGEKDYNVRMTDFNLWQKATMGHKKISFKSYPNLFHPFMESKGLPSPEDYNTTQHVSTEVIQDVAHWILKNG